uniref:Kinetochore protein nuf2 n=1 Tax=Angiostrongylus cantonensis TaxID=6313 RepID=A0A158P6I5_ANGCA
MDAPSRKSRRSSCDDNTVDNTDDINDDQKQVPKRRVSFHNVKTIQNFNEDNFNLLDGTPIKEKIQETIGSDGVLTPGKSHVPSISTPITAHGRNDVEYTSFVDSTITGGRSTVCRFIGPIFSPAYEGPVDMSISDRTDVTGFISIASNTPYEESKCRTLLALEGQPIQHFSSLNISLSSLSYANKTLNSTLMNDTALVFESNNHKHFGKEEYNNDVDGTQNSDENKTALAMNILQTFTEAAAETREYSNDVGSAQNSDENRTALAMSIVQTLSEATADTKTITPETMTEMNCSINESHNEANVEGGEQVGSNFQSSISSGDHAVCSVQSLCDKIACHLKRMIFNTQSMQVNYVSPVIDQPESNVVRELILEELRRMVLNVKEKYRISSSKVAVLLPKLQAIAPTKALALRNMNMRALEFDDEDLFYCGCLRAEIELAQIRLEVAQQARIALEQLIACDESTLKTLREDAQLCSSIDELQKDVQMLQAELSDLPSVDEIAKLVASHKQAVEDEKNLNRQILDLEIQERRLEVELARAKNKDFKETIEKLDFLANTYEMNKARVHAFTQKIHNLHM